MTGKTQIWIAVLAMLSIANLVGVWPAADRAESWHSTVHAVLALCFGLWAQRLRARGQTVKPA